MAVAPSWLRRMFFKFFNIYFRLLIGLRTAAFFHKCVNKVFKVEGKMESNPTLLFVVAAAIIDKDKKILLQNRPLGKTMAGLWEFPGGKVEQGELPEFALVRELKEELNIEIDTKKLRPSCFASEALGSKHLLLLLYIVDEWYGKVAAQEEQDYDWFTMDQILKLDMPPADIPLVSMLRKII